MLDQDALMFTRLRYPEDKALIKQLSLAEKQMWFAFQDSRYMIYLAQEPEFKTFWKWTYLKPLALKRFAYKIKRVFGL